MGQDLASIFLNTIIDASLYSLLGVGFVVLLRCTGVINFAQGALMALAGYFYLAGTEAGLPWPLALLGAVLAAFVLGALLYLLIFRRLVGATLFALVIATLGLATAVTVVMNVVWGPQTRNLTSPFPRDAVFTLAGLPFTRLDLYVVVSAVVGVGLTITMVQSTRLGTRMRAVANSPLLAGLTKINVHGISALAWGLALALTAVAGVSFAMQSAIDPVSAQGYGLVAFAAVLVGGLDSLRGAVLGAVILALVQATVTVMVGSTWSEVMAYTVLLLVLFTRPQGILGTAGVVRI